MNTANVPALTWRIRTRQSPFRLTWLAVLLWLACSHQALANPQSQPHTAAEQIRHWLTLDLAMNPEDPLYHIYSASQFELLWLDADNGNLNPLGQNLLDALTDTAADGWQNYPFQLERIHSLQQQLPAAVADQPASATVQTIAELELHLSRAALAYARLVDQYLLLPDIQETDQGEAVRTALQRRSPPRDSLESLLIAIQQQQLDLWLQQLTPQTPAYRALRNELQRYRQLAERGDWTPLPAPWELTADSHDSHVPQLRQRLLDYGDLSAADADAAAQNPDYFDPALQQALRHFQQRQKLPATGTPGPQTLARLNQPPELIARKIALNMKRQRFMPDLPDDRFILVNAADFRLQLFEYGLETLSMKVIVGKPARRTPVMTQAITQLELAPTWTVPDRIAREYLLPKFRKDPTQVQRYQYRISDRHDPGQVIDPATIDWNSVSGSHFPYRIVQAPGRLNALGQVKFLFPNTQAIYLHDTSSPELFRKDQRALSFGCIRLEKPLALTEHLLAGTTGWDMTRVQNTLKDQRQTRLSLTTPVPLYLMYWTAWVDENGQLQLRDDVYRRDQNAGIRPTERQAGL